MEHAVRESLYGFEVRERDGRRKDGEKKSYDIKQLWDRSREILNLNSMGYKGSEIAKMLGVNKQTVVNTLNSTLGINAVSELRKTRDERYEDLREDVLKLTERSLEIYNEILNEPNESGRVDLKMKKNTADTIVLELSGMRAPTQIQSHTVHTPLTKEDIDILKDRALEAARASGKLVEVEGESK